MQVGAWGNVGKKFCDLILNIMKLLVLMVIYYYFRVNVLDFKIFLEFGCECFLGVFGVR